MEESSTMQLCCVWVRTLLDRFLLLTLNLWCLSGGADLVAKRKSEWLESHKEARIHDHQEEEEEETSEQALPKRTTSRAKAKRKQGRANRKRKCKDDQVLHIIYCKL